MDPATNETMQDSVATVVNASVRPGVRYPAGHYAARPTAGPKVTPSLRLRVARQIDANSGQRLDTDLTRRLQAIAAGDPHDPDTYMRFKHGAQADAVDAWTAGFNVGGAFDVRLGRPSEDVLRHVFGLRSPR